MVLALGYAEKSNPGVKAVCLMETSGSIPLYFVHTSRFCADRLKDKFVMYSLLASADGSEYAKATVFNLKKEASSITLEE